MPGDRKPLNLKLKKGALHKDLGIPKDKKIPLKLIRKKLKDATGVLKKRLVLAKTFKTKFKK